MAYVRGTKALAAAALLLAVAGCAGDGHDPAVTGSPTVRSPSTAPTTATSTPAPPSDSEIASRAASKVVRRYYAVRDELRQDPSKPLSELATIATSTELKAQQTLFSREREQGLHQTGDTKIAKLKVQSVNLDNSDPSAGKVPTVQVDVCWDVSTVDVVDKSGSSVVSHDRPDRGWIRYTVANYHWSAEPRREWRVATSQDLRQTPCAAS